MSWDLIKACLCFVGAGVGMYIAWWLANSADRRDF